LQVGTPRRDRRDGHRSVANSAEEIANARASDPDRADRGREATLIELGVNARRERADRHAEKPVEDDDRGERPDPGEGAAPQADPISARPALPLAWSITRHTAARPTRSSTTWIVDRACQAVAVADREMPPIDAVKPYHGRNKLITSIIPPTPASIVVRLGRIAFFDVIGDSLLVVRRCVEAPPGGPPDPCGPSFIRS
jgi:hypothetical protein